MLRLTIDNGDGFEDYTPFLGDGTLSIDDLVNQPTTINFALVNIARNFEVPRRGAYVKIESLKYNKTLATGFITQDPEKGFIGVSNTAASGIMMGYVVAATSDDWLLNVHMIPFLPAMVNQTMGQILRLLAEALVPNFYTYDIDDGDIVPFFKYDPKKKWSEIAKEFADAVRYRYQVIDRVIYFKPFGDDDLGVIYNDHPQARNGKFSPPDLHTTVFGTPIVNDVIVVGDVEPHRIREDHFIGTGVDTDFELRHNVYGGATSLLLEEKWDGASFSEDLWEVVDPDFRFTLNGALNVTAGAGPVSLGTAYIKGTNGLELGGHLDIEHGEFDFTAIGVSGTGTTGTGIIGGIYNDSSLVQATCEVGFYVSGTLIYPIVDGVKGAELATVLHNKHYRLQTVISASKWSRYNKIYRTLAGESFGGTELASEATVTFLVQEIDLDLPGKITLYKHTETMVLSAFGLYAPINSVNLQAVVTYTQIAKPVQGTLLARSLYGPYGDQLPVRPANIGPEQHYILGFGLQNQTATIGTTHEHDLLRFYDDTIPAVGSRIKLDTWESGKAVARVRDEASVNVEAVISGDDGVRAAIVTDLNPLPRTSEDCDQAAIVFIKDRTTTQFNGTYTFYDNFLDEFINYATTKIIPTGPVFPRSGRFFNINSPMRGIVDTPFLVRSVKMQVESMIEEKILFTIEFGPSNQVQKLLSKFLRIREDVLSPKDLAERPLIQAMTDVGTSFLPDLVDVNVVGLISGNAFTVNVGYSVTGTQEIEIRRVDSGWGVTDQNLILRTSDLEFNLDRNAIEQAWYFRIIDSGGKTSRRTTVIRIVYPLIPDPPGGVLDTRDWLKPEVILTIPGDIRNVWGIEIRSCMETELPVTLLRQACGALTGNWEANSLVGPFQGLTAGEFYGIFTLGGKIITQKTTDYGETWNIVADSHSVLSPAISSFRAKKEGDYVVVATQQTNGRVALSRLDLSNDSWDLLNKQAVASASFSAGGASVDISQRYSASGTTYGIFYQIDDTVDPYRRAAYIETTDNGDSWSSPLAIGRISTFSDTVGRVVPDSTGRMIFFFGDTNSPGFGHYCVQTLSASNSLSAASTWDTGGGLSQIQSGRIVGDYCVFTESGSEKVAIPLRGLDDVIYAVFTIVDNITAPDVYQKPTGEPTTYLAVGTAKCPQASMRYSGGTLHLIGKKFNNNPGTFLWHKSSGDLNTWTPTAQHANQMGPTYNDYNGIDAQEVGADLVLINGRKYIAAFTRAPNVQSGKTIAWTLIAVDTLPTGNIDSNTWFADCNQFIPDPLLDQQIDIEAPIELLDQGLKAVESVLVGTDYISQNKRFTRSEWLFDYTKYAPDTQFYFEGNFTNASFTKGRRLFVWKMMRGRTGELPRIVHTITIPPQTFRRRLRFTELFIGYFEGDPDRGVDPGIVDELFDYEDAYQFELEKEGPFTDAYNSNESAILPNAAFEIHELRLISHSVGAPEAVIDIPMSCVGTAPSSDDVGESEFSTSSTSYVDISSSSVWTYNESEWDTISKLRLVATLSQTVAGSGVCAFVDLGTSAVIAEVAVPVLPDAKAVGVDFDVADLTDGHKYVLRLKSTSGSGTAHFYKGSTRVRVTPIRNLNIYWRDGKGGVGIDNQRDARIFYNPEINSNVAGVFIEAVGASAGTFALVNGESEDGTLNGYPGWFGYLPAGNDLDHVPAQTYTSDTNFADTVAAYQDEKTAGTLTIDSAIKYRDQIQWAAWQFELMASIVGSAQALQGIIDINALRDQIFATINADITALIAALSPEITFPGSKDAVRSAALTTLEEGNRYWAYGTGSVIQSFLMYKIDITVEDDDETDINNLPLLPLNQGDVLLQRVFKSPSDLKYIFENNRYKIRNLCFDCYFFNLMWEYSSVYRLEKFLAPPPAPKIEVVSVLSYDINIRLDVISDKYIDTVSVTVELSTNPRFVGKVTRIKGGPLQSIYSLHAVGGVGPVSNQYIRAKRTDYLGDSEWSEIIFVSAEALIGSAVQNVGDGEARAITIFTGTNNEIEDSGLFVSEDGRILNVNTPTASGDAVNKAYVDTIVASLSGMVSASGNTKNAITFIVDGSDTVITTGTKKPRLPVPYSGVIASVTMTASPSGSVVADIYKDSFVNDPPNVSDSITASAKPTITNGTKSKDTTLTGWNKTVTIGDIFVLNIDSCSGITYLLIQLEVDT